MAKKVGRPRTSTTRSDAKREYDRLRMRLKAEYKKAGRDWNEYKDALSFKNIKEHLAMAHKINPKSPATKRRLNEASKLIRQAFQDRITVMKNINEQGKDIFNSKGELVRKGIGTDKVMKLYYNLESSSKEVVINGKKYKFLKDGDMAYGLHNGKMKVLREVGRRLKPTESDMMPSFDAEESDDIDFSDDFMNDYDEPIDKGYDDYEDNPIEWEDDAYDIDYDFDDEFEGAEYKGEL